MSIELGRFPKGIELGDENAGLLDRIFGEEKKGTAFEFLIPGEYKLETPTDYAGTLTVQEDGNAVFKPTSFSKETRISYLIDDPNKGFLITSGNKIYCIIRHHSGKSPRDIVKEVEAFARELEA